MRTCFRNENKAKPKDDAGNYTCAPTNAKADSVMVHVIDGKIH